jgi:peptidoglycan hydrolase-like protein with peptidoglycan-binding domain
MTLAALVAKQPLRRSAKAADVRVVEIALRAAGHELVVDGDYGRITEATVRRFKTANRLALPGAFLPGRMARIMPSRLMRCHQTSHFR